MIVRQTPSYPQSDVQLSHVKRPDSVAEAENTCSTGEYEFVVRQTTSTGRQMSSYLTPNVQLVWSRANARAVQVRTGWLWVKRPVIRRQTSVISRQTFS